MTQKTNFEFEYDGASLVIADIPDMNEISVKWKRVYSNYIFSILCWIHRLLKSWWSAVLFFNMDYMPWIEDELDSLGIFAYKWIFVFDSDREWSVKSRYHICYRLHDELTQLNKCYPQKYRISNIDFNTDSFIESLILNFTKPGETVINSFTTAKELSSVCEKLARKCITIPIIDTQGKIPVVRNRGL